jgi:hypothetical protein
VKKIFALLVLVSYIFLLAPTIFAQEHWTEGPVWQISFYRTKQGHFDDYLKYLRTNYLPQAADRKKEALILDTKIFVKNPTSPSDWDVGIATLYPSYAKALDYSKEDDDKDKAISANHFKTDDEKKQQDTIAPRFEMRDFVGSDIVREVNLRPMT